MSQKEISRRDFIKGAAGVAGVAAFGMLTGCSNAGSAAATTAAAPTDAATTAATEAPTTAAAASSEKQGIYTPGTYSAKGKGLNDLVVTMTFNSDAITDIVLNLEGETPNIGQAAAEELKAALMEKQSAEIDIISGATLTCRGVMEAADKCIRQAKGEIPVEVIGEASAEAGTAGWLGQEPEIGDVSETWDTDILIVGAGNGGCATGAYAASKGLKFRIIEKMDTVNRVRGWYAALDSDDILAAGEKPADRAALLNELKRYSSGKLNMRTWTTWMNESAAMHNFVKEIYAIYYPDAELTVTVGEEARWPESEGFFFPAIEHTWSRTEMSRNEMFAKYMEDAGYSIDFGVALVKLEKTDNRVTGVIAQKTDTGAYIRINAAKGVILTTGGFPGNPEMMEQLDPMGCAVTTSNVCSPQDTGDGIKAAVWAGAALQAEPAPMLFDRGIVPPGVDAGYQTLESGAKIFPGTEGQFGLGTQPFLKVNRRGERFTNESGTYDMMSYAAINQPGGVYAQIFDAGMPEDLQRFHTIGCSAGARRDPQGRLKAVEQQAEKGNAFIADTLEELADKLGFFGKSKDTFLATCARYNELYDQQRDDDFGKPAYKLSALKTAPFYGYWMGACLLTTEQGVLIDEKARVLGTDKEPMEGLFASGDCSGGFFVNNYPCLMPGVACGKAMTYGIKAVKVASGEES